MISHHMFSQYCFRRFGNACTTGGLRIAGRLNLVKQSMNDNTILMPNNHLVEIKDLENGDYLVSVATMMPCTVKLIVNMDKDLPGATGELPPLQLTFVRYSEPAADTEQAVEAEAIEAGTSLLSELA